MAENTGTLNQSLDRRRDEKAAEHMMQDSVSRLSNIAVDGLEPDGTGGAGVEAQGTGRIVRADRRTGSRSRTGSPPRRTARFDRPRRAPAAHDVENRRHPSA